jgi:cell division septation protein DedD
VCGRTRSEKLEVALQPSKLPGAIASQASRILRSPSVVSSRNERVAETRLPSAPVPWISPRATSFPLQDGRTSRSTHATSHASLVRQARASYVVLESGLLNRARAAAWIVALILNGD